MMHDVSAELVAIGTEILLGEITDTNSVYLARTLRDLGINVYFMTSVGDNVSRIVHALKTAMARADIVITCGGLGPTVDDMTREAVAQTTDRQLVFSPDLQEQIAARFRSFNARMTDNNLRQAYLPADALEIENPVGTAPAFIVEHGEKVIISLPGVPRELKYLTVERVVPYLRQRYALGIIKAKILKTAGIGESLLDDMLGTELLNSRNPSIGLAAHQGVIDIRITAKAEDEATADQMITELEASVYERVGRYIFGTNGDQIEDVLFQLLRSQSWTLSVIEAGLVDLLPTSARIMGEETGVLRSVESFSHPDLIVVEGEAAQALRDKALSVAKDRKLVHQTNASICVLSLPRSEDQSDMTHSTAVAICVGEQQAVRTYGFGAQVEYARDWVSRWALSLTWRLLRDQIEDVEDIC